MIPRLAPREERRVGPIRWIRCVQLCGRLLVLVSGLFLPAPAARAAEPPAAVASESEKLHRLFERAWEDKLSQAPEFATYIGFPGHNDRWSDYSEAGIERRHALAREQLKALLAIDRSRLPALEQVDLDLFRRRLEGQIEGFGFPDEQMPLSQNGGIQQSASWLLTAAPAATLRDYEDLLARLSTLPARVDQELALLEKGLAAGVTPPKSMMLGAPDQVRALLPDDPWQSPLLARFRQIPSDVPPEDQARLRAAALEATRRRSRRPSAGSCAISRKPISLRPGGHRRRRPPERRRLVRLHRAQGDHHGPDAGADPRDRPRRGEAHPGGDGSDHRRHRVPGELRRVRAVPPHRSPIFL